MKVLQIANGYLDKALYKHLFTHMNVVGVDNEVVVPVKKGTNKKNEEKNVKVIECFNSFDRFLFFSKQQKTVNSISSNYNVANFDIIHAHTLFSTGYAAHKLNKKYGIPFFVAVRNTDLNVFLEKFPLFRRIGLRIMRDAAGIIFLSPKYRDVVINKYIPKTFKEEIYSKSFVIPNGIDDFYLDNPPDSSHDIHSPLKIIHVGDVNKNKNITTTLSAIDIIQKQDIAVEYIVIGEEKDPEIVELLKQKDYVNYCGKKPKEQVLEYLREADIFVMPSHHETFGLVYAEAMSQGLPVIYTKNEGFDGQFEDGIVGYAVNDKDPNNVAECILKIMKGYCSFSANCIGLSEEFNWSTIAKKYKVLYEKAMLPGDEAP